jgi:hypothetical protein
VDFLINLIINPYLIQPISKKMKPLKNYFLYAFLLLVFPMLGCQQDELETMNLQPGGINKAPNPGGSSIFHQSILTCALRDLRAAAEMSHVKQSSTHRLVARRAPVCITPARKGSAPAAAAEKFVRQFTNLHAGTHVRRGTFATRQSS